ncbi:MAG: ATP-binding cassette domain-containing protein [Pseudomonadota bacterium]|jgi:lipooligosaccharide transport system ATP-binding protein|nr:ATP-binding cassette domain-containing protein [Pseudomonadota bacterium]
MTSSQNVSVLKAGEIPESAPQIQDDRPGPQTDRPVAIVRALQKSYAGKTVVDRVSFDIRRGEFCGLLGPNGAGKTTILRMLVGNSVPDSGSLEVLGYPVPREARRMRARVGIVPQSDNLDPDLSVVENLFVYGRYFGISGDVLEMRVPELLTFASLTDWAGSRINQLSGGMMRRLSIARALINKPELLILDEPTTGLDPQARHTIWQQLRQMQREGMTLILTTHYMEEAERLCDRIIVMDHGALLADRSPEQLISEEIEAHVLEVHGSGVSEWWGTVELPTGVRCEKVGETVFFYGENLHGIVDRLDGKSGLRYSYRPANLEDVFLKLTGRDLRDV